MPFLIFVIMVSTMSIALATKSWPATIIALATIASYAFERFWEIKADKKTEQDIRIADLDIKFESLKSEYRNLVSVHMEIVKQSEDVKKIVQQHNLKQMFGPKV